VFGDFFEGCGGDGGWFLDGCGDYIRLLGSKGSDVSEGN